ncbi:hypothetical protein AB0P15_02975 [Streptomyces sp. NPDC087917]
MEHVNGDALDAARLRVGTVLNAAGPTAEGRVRLTGATCGVDLLHRGQAQ